MIAHAVTTNATDKAFFENALVLEADWGLGRNPLNMIQMTTATTSLESKRSVENIYTTGRNDGTPGVHPGQTPYLGTGDWSTMIMGRPSWMTAKCYPDYEANWPKAEGYFNTRYVYAHSEFTPQQTMRGKMALYGYLYGVNKPKTQTYTLNVNSVHGTILKNPDQTIYNYGDSVTITLMPDADYPLIKWAGDASGSTNPIKIGMYSNKNITAEFTFPVGIQQLEEMPVVLSPNPASDFIYLKKTGDVGTFKLFISDMNGKLIMGREILAAQNQVNISELKQGIYCVRIEMGSRLVDSKLVVMRN